MLTTIFGSTLLALAFTPGALLSRRPIWLSLVALGGIAAFVAQWLVWVSNNGGFDKYPGEVLMNLYAAILFAGMWVAAVLVGAVTGSLVRARRGSYVDRTASTSE